MFGAAFHPEFLFAGPWQQAGEGAGIVAPRQAGRRVGSSRSAARAASSAGGSHV